MVHLSRAFLLATALVVALFSGCILPVFEEEGGATAGPQPIVKKAVLTIDSNNEDADSIEDFLQVSFEYTHMGAAAAPADLTAEFTGSTGEERSRNLGTFTTKPMLDDGDVVTITGANLTSGLVVKKGAEVLAQRGSIKAPWFIIEDVPIPIASTEVGEAIYKLASSAGFSASGSDFDVDETHINTVSAELAGALNGDVSLKTSRPAGATRLEARLMGTPSVNVDVSASVTDSEGTFDAGIKTTNMQGSIDVRGMMQFDASRELSKVGGGGDFTFDGQVHVWDRDHPKSQNYEPEDIEHPMVNEHTAYSEEDVEDDGGEGPPAWIVSFITRLWSTEIGVGDDYRIHYNQDFGDGGMKYDLIIQITADEPRSAGGEVYPSLRVSQVGSLVIDPPNQGSTTFDLMKTTYWVHKTSHLPVYAQTKYTRSFDRDDIEQLLETFGEEAPASIPATASLVLQGDQTLELRSYSGDLTVAPLFGLFFANPVDYGGVLPGVAASAFFLGGSSHDEPAQQPPPPPWPHFQLSLSESEDMLTVSTASQDAEWSRVSVRGDRAFSFRLNGGDLVEVPASQYEPVTAYYEPMTAGDMLEFCLGGLPAPLSLTFRDDPTNNFVADFSFSSVVGPC